MSGALERRPLSDLGQGVVEDWEQGHRGLDAPRGRAGRGRLGVTHGSVTQRLTLVIAWTRGRSPMNDTRVVLGSNIMRLIGRRLGLGCK